MVPVRALCQASCNTGGTFCRSDVDIGQASYHCRRGRLRSELASQFLGSLFERRLRNRTWKKKKRSITRRRGFTVHYLRAEYQTLRIVCFGSRSKYSNYYLLNCKLNI